MCNYVGLFCYLERQTGVNKTLLAILLVAATCYLSIKFFGVRPYPTCSCVPNAWVSHFSRFSHAPQVAKVINFVVFVWPAYSTYKVLEGSNLDEHLFWYVHVLFMVPMMALQEVSSYVLRCRTKGCEAMNCI